MFLAFTFSLLGLSLFCLSRERRGGEGRGGKGV